MKLSIIIPAYNEEKRIEPVLEEYLNTFKKAEIIVMIEGTDNTINIIKKLKRKYKNLKYVYSKDRLGKGGAIINGFKEANGDVIGFTDADGSINANSFNKLVNEIENYDCIISSRKIKGAKITKNRPLLQRFGSWGFNLLTKLILGLPFTDTQCGAKVFKKIPSKYLIEKVKSKDWAFDADILYNLKKAKFKIKEMPIDWEHKAGAHFNFAKFFWKLIPAMFISLFKVRFK